MGQRIVNFVMLVGHQRRLRALDDLDDLVISFGLGIAVWSVLEQHV